MKYLAAAILALTLVVGVKAQNDDEKVTISKKMLTKEQLDSLNQNDLRHNVSAWAGVGKEVGDAVNASLQAITTQSNNFAQTGVGKLTMAIVVWKIFGDQLIHVLGGLFEVVLFVPIWLWSYRKTCMTRSIKIGKDTYEKIVYNSSGDMTPRAAHCLAAGLFVIVVAITVYSY